MSNELVVLIVNDESKLKKPEVDLIRSLTQEFSQHKIEIKLLSTEKFLEMDATKRPLWLEAYPQNTRVTFLPLCRGFELNDGVIHEMVQMIQARPELIDSTAVAVFPAGQQTQSQIRKGLEAYLSMLLGSDESEFHLKNKLTQRVVRFDTNNFEETSALLKDVLGQLPEKQSLANTYNEQPLVRPGLVDVTKHKISDAKKAVTSNTFNIGLGLISLGALASVDRSSSLAFIYYGLYVLALGGIVGVKNSLPAASEKLDYLAYSAKKTILHVSHTIWGEVRGTNQEFVDVLKVVKDEIRQNSKAFRRFTDNFGADLHESSQALLAQIDMLREDATGQTQTLLENVSRAIVRAGDLTEDNLHAARNGVKEAFDQLRQDFNRRGDHLDAVLENQMNRFQNTLEKGTNLVGNAAQKFATKTGDAAEILANKAGSAAETFANKTGDAAQEFAKKTGDAAGVFANKAGDGISKVGDGMSKVGDAAGVFANKAGDGISKVGDGMSKVGDAAREGKLQPVANATATIPVIGNWCTIM